MAVSRKFLMVATCVAGSLCGGLLVGGFVVARSGGRGVKSAVESPQQADKREANANETPVVAVRPRRDPSLVISVQQLLKVEAFLTAEVRSQVAGVVHYVRKTIHDPVSKGEVLVAIDVPDLEQDVLQKDAVIQQRLQDVRVARAQAANAKAMVDVYKEAIEQRQAEVGQAEATRDFRLKIYNRYAQLGTRDVTQKGIIEEEERNYRAAEFAVSGAQAAARRATAEFHEKESALEIAKADIGLKETLVEVAVKSRDQARALLDYSQFTAPFDGVVVKRKVDPGTFIQSGPAGHSDPMMVIARTDVVTLVMKVPDNAAPYVTLDTEAVIQIDELPGVVIRGRVTRFSPSIENQDRTMRVEVDLYNDTPEKYGQFVAHAMASRLAPLAGDSPLGLATLLAGGRDVWNLDVKSDLNPLPALPVVTGKTTTARLLPGMSGYMRLNLQSFKNATLIPSSAVFTRGGKPYLLEVKDGVTRLVPVHVQVTDGKLAKVSVVVDEGSPIRGQPAVLRDLTGEEVLILNRQEEVGEGHTVKVTMKDW
jgi:multidrug resistance efflux pump